MKNNLPLKRRLPVYIVGVLFGVLASIFLFKMKAAFAPKFEEKIEERAVFAIDKNGKIRLKFLQNPEMHLIPGYPSELRVGKVNGEKVETVNNLGYAALTKSQEQLLGPFAEGKYEIRMQLFDCPTIGAEFCWKKRVVQPFIVSANGASEAILEVELAK